MSEEQISPVYALDGSRRLSRERLTCLETSSCACVCVSLHITTRNKSVSGNLEPRLARGAASPLITPARLGSRDSRDEWNTGKQMETRASVFLGGKSGGFTRFGENRSPRKPGLMVTLGLKYRSIGSQEGGRHSTSNAGDVSWVFLCEGRERNLERAVDFSIFQHRMRVNKQGEEREKKGGMLEGENGKKEVKGSWWMDASGNVIAEVFASRRLRAGSWRNTIAFHEI